MHTLLRALRKYFTGQQGKVGQDGPLEARFGLLVFGIALVTDFVGSLAHAPTREAVVRTAVVLVLLIALVLAWRLPWAVILG